MPAAGGPSIHAWRFALAWLLPLCVGAAALRSAGAAWAVAVSFQVALALIELLPIGRRSPPPAPGNRWFAACLRSHVLWQAVLMAIGLRVVSGYDAGGSGATFAAFGAIAMGLAVGSVSGSQGITFAHELGHSRSKLDRALAWGLMASVNYSHFMVEHYRGHHPRAATHDDPASARRGEGLWRFLPRTLVGSLRSAWSLEAQRLQRLHRGWVRSPLLWAALAQAVWLVAVPAAFGRYALLFWIVQSAYAVFLLEAINYVEHYGLLRRRVDGKHEPFGMQHAWNSDHWLTNSFIANLQRHSDHHMHPWQPYASLDLLPGPRLPTGYAGCIWLAAVPPLWCRAMERRLERLEA